MHRYRVKPRFYIIAICLVLLVFGISIGIACGTLNGEERILAAVELQRDELQTEVVGLRGELAFAQSDEYVEYAARQDLGMIYPGEIRYVGN